MDAGVWWRNKVWEVLHYEPSVEQAIFHDSDARFRCVAGGIQSGKSFSVAKELHKYSVIRSGFGWLVGPDYEQVKAEFGYLMQDCRDLGILDESSLSFPQRGSARFKLIPEMGAFEWQTKSASDPVSLASFAPDVVVMCEAAQQSHQAFMKCLERVARKGAPLILSGTFESSLGWYAEVYEEWMNNPDPAYRSFSLPTWSNLVSYPGGRTDPKIKQIEGTMPPDLFSERFGAVPTRPSGLVFPQFDRTLHLKPAKELYDPDLPVEIWVDPATHTYAVLFVQVKDDVVHVLDEVYEHNAIGQEVIPKVIAHRYWSKVQDGVIDIAAKQRQGNKSQIQVWADELKARGQHGVRWKMRYVYEEQWRNAIALRLAPPEKEPMLYFADHLNARTDSTGRANGILGEFLTYRWPQFVEGKSQVSRPIKQNEDALSALGYGLFAHFGAVLQRRAKSRAKVRGQWT